MNLQSIRDFVARGDAFRDDVSVPVTIIGSYDSLGYGPVQCTVILDTEQPRLALGDLFDDQRTTQLRGRTRLGKGIWIPRFRLEGTTFADDQISWKGTAELFVEGVVGDLNEFDASGGEITCLAFIPPTPIALSHAVYAREGDGTTTIVEGERKPICWNTTLGAAELIDTYRYHDGEKAGLDQASIRVRRCQVTIKIQSSGTVSLRSISRDLEDALDEALWLLSFLSRKRIPWYGAEVYFDPGDGSSRDFRKAVVRREQWIGYEHERQAEFSWVDLLVKQEALREGLFQQLYANYEASPFRNTIHRIIPYLLMSHGRGYIEPRLGIIYSALEGLVSSLDEDNQVGCLLDPHSFKNLSKKLRFLIQKEIEEQDIVEGINKKLGGLNQRSFVDRLLMLIKKYDLDVTKLWALGADIPSELRKLMRRRNIYVHQGKIDDYALYIFDFYRILNLVELWILKLLDCPDTAINSLALRSHVPINKP